VKKDNKGKNGKKKENGHDDVHVTTTTFGNDVILHDY